MDFNEILGTSKAQQIRAWAVDQAISHSNHSLSFDSIIGLASMIEEFVTSGERHTAIAAAVEEGRSEALFEFWEHLRDLDEPMATAIFTNYMAGKGLTGNQED